MNHLGEDSYIGPSKYLFYEINQDMKDANYAAITHAAILKNKVDKPRLMQFNEIKNEAISVIKNFPHGLQEIENWKNVKRKTVDAVDNIRIKTVSKIKHQDKKLDNVGKSIKLFFMRNQSHNQNMDALYRIAKLKDSGVLTLKEFNSLKKKILKKI